MKLTPSKPWRLMGGVDVLLHSFLTSALDRCEWSNSRPGRFIPEKDHGARSMGCWVRLRASVDGFEQELTSFPCQDLNPDPSRVGSRYTEHAIPAPIHMKYWCVVDRAS